MTSSEYVTNASWLRTAGRIDAVDEIADQFERPAAEPHWVGEASTAWPTRARSWRPAPRLHRAKGATLAR